MTCNRCLFTTNGTVPTPAVTTQPPTTPLPSKAPTECGYFEITCDPRSIYDGVYQQSFTAMNQHIRFVATTMNAVLYWEGTWVISNDGSDIRLMSSEDTEVPSSGIW